jgi:hypothetical protein
VMKNVSSLVRTGWAVVCCNRSYKISLFQSPKAGLHEISPLGGANHCDECTVLYYQMRFVRHLSSPLIIWRRFINKEGVRSSCKLAQ